MRERTNSNGGVFGAATALVLCLVVGCHSTPGGPGHSFVSQELGARTGATLGVGDAGYSILPPDVLLEDGLTEDEAVAVAMWNNALLHETLTELGVSRARLYDAGLLTDPQFTMFLPLGPKQFEMSIFQSVDVLWLRPIREQAACLDLNAVAQRMVQSGLDTIRDTRQAHADLLFAQERSALADEAARLRAEIRDLAEKRLAAGDIGELEVMTIRVEALRAEADARRFARDVEIARHRLVQLIGLRGGCEPYAVDFKDAIPPLLDREMLVGEAMAMRPDLRAAEIDVEAACRRCELAKNQFMTLDAVYDANSRGTRGFESGPGLRFSLPIFNGNRGGRAIAAAAYDQAVSRTETIRDQIAVEVRTAHTSVERADENLRAVRDEILPALAEAESLARSNYAAGGAPYFLVLETTSRFLDARARELELEAELQRAIADLERGVGRRLAVPLPLHPVELPEESTPVDLELVPPEPAENPEAAPVVPVPEIEQTAATRDMAETHSTVLRLEDVPPAPAPSTVEASVLPAPAAQPETRRDARSRYPLRPVDDGDDGVRERGEAERLWREARAREGREASE